MTPETCLAYWEQHHAVFGLGDVDGVFEDNLADFVEVGHGGPGREHGPETVAGEAEPLKVEFGQPLEDSGHELAVDVVELEGCLADLSVRAAVHENQKTPVSHKLAINRG